jgi:hypothetical protein
MEKIVVYILNNNTFYLKMAINSISMLRKHNNKIKILCLATEAIKIPENLNVEIKIIKNIDENYFPSNKTHLLNVEHSSVLYLDCDTFIFDDIKKIFNNCSKDFYGNENNWTYSLGFNKFKPFNSGVLLFNNYSHKKIYEDFKFKLINFKKFYPDVCDWMDNIKNHWVRDEFLLSSVVYEDKISCDFFEKKYVKITEKSQDFKDTIVFHSFASNWNIINNSLNQAPGGE